MKSCRTQWKRRDQYLSHHRQTKDKRNPLHALTTMNNVFHGITSIKFSKLHADVRVYISPKLNFKRKRTVVLPSTALHLHMTLISPLPMSLDSKKNVLTFYLYFKTSFSDGVARFYFGNQKTCSSPQSSFPTEKTTTSCGFS